MAGNLQADEPAVNIAEPAGADRAPEPMQASAKHRSAARLRRCGQRTKNPGKQGSLRNKEITQHQSTSATA